MQLKERLPEEQPIKNLFAILRGKKLGIKTAVFFPRLLLVNPFKRINPRPKEEYITIRGKRWKNQWANQWANIHDWMPNLVVNSRVRRSQEMIDTNLRKFKLYNAKVLHENIMCGDGGFCGCRRPMVNENCDNEIMKEYIRMRKNQGDMAIAMRNKLKNN